MKAQQILSVYLVEDDKLYAAALSNYLIKLFKTKIHAESFTNGEVCLKKIERNPETAADVVILDYYLNSESSKAMNGLEILKKIKKINSGIAVVILSAQDKFEIAAESLKYGAYEYIVKSESAFIRTHHILKNLIERFGIKQVSKGYEKWNVSIAIALIILIIIDIIFYYHLFR